MSILSNKKITIKSPAKINLHLEVIGKREDGFHELAMIMQYIDLADYLEFEINENGLIKLESECNDLSLSRDNLIVRAANLLREKLNIDPKFSDILFLSVIIETSCRAYRLLKSFLYKGLKFEQQFKKKKIKVTVKIFFIVRTLNN